MKKNADYVTKSPFKERMNKMVGEFREQNKQFLQGNYKPPTNTEESKPSPSKQTPKKTTATPVNNTEYRRKAYANQLNKYQGGE